MVNLRLNLLTLPLWWYTTGLGLIWDWTKKEYFFGLHKTGILIFARHLNEPLYGDYTKAGIIISFFLRLIILAYKFIIFLIRTAIITILSLLYILALPSILVMIIFQILALQNHL